MKTRVWLLIAVTGWCLGCNRNMEPFVPGEEPREPDLSKIFPAGAQAPPNQASLPPSPMGDRGAPPVASVGQPITGTVEVAPELAGEVSGNSVLFLIARKSAAGPPLAVKRIASPRFPFEFSIGPEDRMIQTMPFTGPLTLTARLDADGNASTREAGDLQGSLPDVVDPGARDLTLRLDELL